MWGQPPRLSSMRSEPHLHYCSREGNHAWFVSGYAFRHTANIRPENCAFRRCVSNPHRLHPKK